MSVRALAVARTAAPSSDGCCYGRWRQSRKARCEQGFRMLCRRAPFIVFLSLQLFPWAGLSIRLLVRRVQFLRCHFLSLAIFYMRGDDDRYDERQSRRRCRSVQDRQQAAQSLPGPRNVLSAVSVVVVVIFIGRAFSSPLGRAVSSPVS